MGRTCEQQQGSPAGSGGKELRSQEIPEGLQGVMWRKAASCFER
jgi:hypothetical protein